MPNRRMLLVCAMIFALNMLVFHALLWLLTPPEDPLRTMTTQAVSLLLNLSGVFNIADGTHIVMRNALWDVTPECTAINPLVLFVSFVLAYPAAIKARMIGVAAGIPTILTVNLGRLYVLGLLTEYHPDLAKGVHDYVWQAGFLVFLVFLWLVWIEVVVKRCEKSSSLPAAA